MRQVIGNSIEKQTLSSPLYTPTLPEAVANRAKLTNQQIFKITLLPADVNVTSASNNHGVLYQLL